MKSGAQAPAHVRFYEIRARSRGLPKSNIREILGLTHQALRGRARRALGAPGK